MINKNLMGLRVIALKSFSATINHCKTTPVVTEQIKKTRNGLVRISLDYITGLSKIYCNSQNNKAAPAQILQLEERAQILRTLQDFASVAKTVKLSSYFLTSFAELTSELESGVKGEIIQQKLDVLIAMMEKVVLKKRENYLSLMTGVKVFIADSSTQKRGYKLLARIIEKYELQSVEELYEIREEITPLMRGQATK